MGLSVWRETSKKLTVYRVCYTPIETLFEAWWSKFNYGKIIGYSNELAG